MSERSAWQVGDLLERVRVGRIAHGGHWVAREDGRVIFVRHALEGELVDVVITKVARRHAFGDAVSVREASPHRVAAPCPIAASCGGCDFQHVEPAHQRELKTAVVRDLLERMAHASWKGSVEEMEPSTLGWRTRMRYHRSGREWGLRARGSHDVVPLPAEGCLIARPGLAHPDGHDLPGPTVVGADTADGIVWQAPGEGELVRQQAIGRTWSVRADGFWQVHPQAPDALVSAVLAVLRPAPGERALDLYCGVGLFAGALVDAGVTVTGVEGSRDAVELARVNVPQARFVAGSVDRVLARRRGRVDVVVMDPPRVGAGRVVMEAVCARRPRAIAYVACDPAALARDVATAAALGYRLASLRAFDLFGTTHHVECVALLVPERATMERGEG